MNKSSKIALGILGAAAVGAVLALLYTDKGKEVSKKMGKKAGEMKDHLTDLWHRRAEKANGFKKRAEASV